MLVILAVVLASSAAAQGFRGTAQEQKAAFDKNFAELFEALSLDEETSPIVKDVLWAAQEQRTELFASMRGSGSVGRTLARSGMRDEMNEINKETLASLGELFTKEQLEIYLEIQETQRQGRGQGRRQQRQNNPQ